MPSRNVLKIDASQQYYHVYARGNNRSSIFYDHDDYAVFLNLLKRYLSKDTHTNKLGAPYPNLHNELSLLCFCLMPNHFHLLVYQDDKGAMTRLMRAVMTSYTRYFNAKYDRSGTIWESRFKASLIDMYQYLTHITRYIHLNPGNWSDYPYSSLPYYRGDYAAEWLQPGLILDMFTDAEEYVDFLADYEGHKSILDSIKPELANTI